MLDEEQQAVVYTHADRFWRKYRRLLCQAGIDQEDVRQQVALLICEGKDAYLQRRLLDWLREATQFNHKKKEAVFVRSTTDYEWLVERRLTTEQREEQVDFTTRALSHAHQQGALIMDIVTKTLQGHTLPEIGRRHGVSATRIHQRMSAWKKAFAATIVGVVCCLLPLVSHAEVSNVVVASGKTYPVMPDGLVTGVIAYIDRSFFVSAVPEVVQGATYLQTANDDKGATHANFLTFMLDAPATVYVAYDQRIPSPPSWLGAFQKTSHVLATNDTSFDLYQRDYPAGPVVLGGNQYHFSMYIPIVVDSAEPPPPPPPPPVDTMPPAIPKNLTIHE